MNIEKLIKVVKLTKHVNDEYKPVKNNLEYKRDFDAHLKRLKTKINNQAKNIVREIKANYPQVKIREENLDRNDDLYIPGVGHTIEYIVGTKLLFSNYPTDSAWLDFLKKIGVKYIAKPAYLLNVYPDRWEIFEDPRFLLRIWWGDEEYSSSIKNELRKDSVKDEAVFYKGYTIEKTSIFSYEKAGYPYVITKHRDIKSGANSIDEAKKKIDKLVAAKNSVKDGLYTYEFPKFTAEDRSQARRYGLEIIRETSQDTIVRGDLKKIKEFADNYLGYQLNKDYLSKDSVKDFGMRNPAKIIPEHQAYFPEYSPEEFKSKLDFFVKQTIDKDATGGMKQIEGLLETVLNDYHTDIVNKELDKNKTLTFYKKYVTIANQIVSKYRDIPGPVRDLIETRMYNIK